jgi:dTDP-4-dehydrorhamnose 3,5-epimerase
MTFTETALRGAFIVDVQPHEDERGFFARTWCVREFEDHGLNPRLVQCSFSSNTRKGTLRGLHYQAAPFAEAKLVRCTKGAIYDVIVDLRPGSPTRGRHVGVELTAANHRALYVPEGFAHGLLTLADDTEVLYQISEFYHPDASTGVRWNDPAFGIDWPARPAVISARDAAYPDFSLGGDTQ